MENVESNISNQDSSFSQISTEKLVKDKINTLQIEDKNKVFGCGKDSIKIHHGFIDETMKIKSNEHFDSLVLDDPSLYTDFFDFIKDKTIQNEPHGISFVQDFLYSYFGANGDQLSRIDIYASGKLGTNISVSELKGKNAALCSERAAVSQNLLTLLGYQSDLIYCQINYQGKEKFGDHVANIITAQNGRKFIYDPQNPVLLDTGYVPAISSINNEQYENFINKGFYDFDYSTIKKLYPDNSIVDNRKRTYSTNQLK